MAVRWLLVAGILCTATSTLAEIRYTIDPAMSRDQVTVQMEFKTQGTSTTVKMPSWSPGFYVLENYWQTLDSVVATDAEGNTLPISRPQPDTWSLSTPANKLIKLTYSRSVKPDMQRIGMFSSDPVAIHIVGPKTFMYVDGRKEESCRLDARVPEGWDIAIGLNPIKSEEGTKSFRAPDYDALVDNPITLGEFLMDKYRVQNKDHFIALRGPSKFKVDRAKLIRMCEFITKAQSDFMGGLPFDRYVWHFWVNDMPDGSGGVEHASSTHMFIGKGLGPAGLMGISHEFFHLWNVKRIRSSVLGPFDYSKLPATGALWWLEGVTDYYAHMLPYRYGAWGQSGFLADISDAVESFRNSPGRLEASPYESSFRIPEANNTNGYKISYYVNGWVLGMLFDIELRDRTKGKKSLDDVEKALWNMCRDGKPGFAEDEIRRQLIRFGGEGMGPLYDEWVMKPGNLPIEAQLAKVGIKLEVKQSGNRTQIDAVLIPNASTAQVKLREGWFKQKPLPDAITFAR